MIMTARRDLLSGTQEEVASTLEQISKGMVRHEYLGGTNLRTLAALLAQNKDLLVSVLTYENESQEIEVTLASSPGCGPVMIDRNSTGTECQVTLDLWSQIGTEPDTANTAKLVEALLLLCAPIGHENVGPRSAQRGERGSETTTTDRDTWT